jgi:hypothetical protein
LDNQLLSIYHEKDREYRAIKNKYENDKARLWTDMIEWIDPSVHEKVRLQEAKYLALQKTSSDTLGSYNMLFDTVLCGGTGVNSFGKLRQQWHSLRMYDPRTNEIIKPLSEYIYEYNGYLDLTSARRSPNQILQV